MTIEIVKERCKEIAEKANFSIPCPIKENGRLKKTLGRVCYNEDGSLKVIEFSKSFLENGTEEQLEDTIRHELAHAFTYLETKEHHGHDYYWKAMCERLGAKPSSKAKGQIYKVENSKIYKYTVFCDCCGREVGNYYKAGKVIQNLHEYQSGCCNASLRMVQNY